MGLTSRLKGGVESKYYELLAMLEFLLVAIDHRQELGERVAERRFNGDTRVGRAAQTAQVLAVVVVGVTALIGVLIFSQINNALPDPSNSELNSTSDSITTGFANSMDLVPVVLIVAMAGVVLASVQRFRS